MLRYKSLYYGCLPDYIRVHATKPNHIDNMYYVACRSPTLWCLSVTWIINTVVRLHILVLVYLWLSAYTNIPLVEVWSAQRTTGQKPPAVESHSFVKIDSHRAVVFGGYTGKTNLNDTYVLDMDTWVCWHACSILQLNGGVVPAESVWVGPQYCMSPTPIYLYYIISHHIRGISVT